MVALRTCPPGDLLEQAAAQGERVRQALAGRTVVADTAGAVAAPAEAAEAAAQGSRAMTAPGGVSVVAGPRVGVMASPGAEYVAALWSTWLAGSVAVPLALTHPPAELSYVLRDAGISVVLATDEFAAVLAPLALECGAQLLRLDAMTPKQVRQCQRRATHGGPAVGRQR